MQSYYTVKVDQRAQMLSVLNKIYHEVTVNYADLPLNIKELVNDEYDASLKQKIYSNNNIKTAIDLLKAKQADMLDKLLMNEIKDFYSILNSAASKQVLISSLNTLKSKYTNIIDQFMSDEMKNKLKELIALDDVQNSINEIVKPIADGQELFKYIIDNKQVNINVIEEKLSHLDANQLELIDRICIKLYIKIELQKIRLEKSIRDAKKYAYGSSSSEINGVGEQKKSYSLDIFNEIKLFIIEKETSPEIWLPTLLLAVSTKIKEFKSYSSRSRIVNQYKDNLEALNIQLKEEKLNQCYNDNNFDEVDYSKKILEVILRCYTAIMREDDGPSHNYVLFKTKGSTFAKALETELINRLLSDIELVYVLKINWFDDIDTLKELKKHSKELYEIISCDYKTLKDKIYNKYKLPQSHETSIDIYLNIFLELSAENIRKLRDQIIFNKNRISIVGGYHRKLIKLNYEVFQAKKINTDIDQQINFAKRLLILTIVCFNQIFCSKHGPNSTFAANLRQKLKGFLTLNEFQDVASKLTDEDFREYGWYDSDIAERVQKYIKICIINASHLELKPTKLKIQDLDYVDQTEEHNFSHMRL